MIPLTLFCQNTHVLEHWKNSFDSPYSLYIAGSIDSLFSHITKNPDNIIIFHASSDQQSSIDFLETCKEEYPAAKILILSNIPAFSEGQKYLLLGCKGYGHALMTSTSLQQAVNVIQEGNTWLYPEFVTELIKGLHQIQTQSEVQTNLSALSPREKEIARLVAAGHHNREIAQTLDIKERTVKAHLTNIFQKMGIRDRLSLAMKVNQK